MKRLIVTAASVLLSLVLIVSSLVLLGCLMLRETLFSASYYRTAIAAPEYLPLVRAAIENDLQAQSSYVGIPAETLTAGLDDARIYVLISRHLANVAAYLNGMAPYQPMTYPADAFQEPLNTFIQTYAAANGTAVTAEQTTLLTAVATDSAAIVDSHVNLIDLNRVTSQPLFQQAHRWLYQAQRLALPALLTLAVSGLLLSLLHGRRWRMSLGYALTATWLAASLVLVPAVVLQAYGLTRRLAIQSGYLKFAVDTLLAKANNLLIFWGALFFVLTASGLLFLLLSEPRPPERNPPPRRRRLVHPLG